MNDSRWKNGVTSLSANVTPDQDFCIYGFQLHVMTEERLHQKEFYVNATFGDNSVIKFDLHDAYLENLPPGSLHIARNMGDNGSGNAVHLLQYYPESLQKMSSRNIKFKEIVESLKVEKKCLKSISILPNEREGEMGSHKGRSAGDVNPSNFLGVRLDFQSMY